MTIFTKLLDNSPQEVFIRFTSCDKSKYNSVSSKCYLYDSYYFIEPIKYKYSYRHPFKFLIPIIKNMGCKIITQNENYIHITFTSFFKYIDDVEFEYIKEKQLIHMKSASRSGYWDICKNRRRLEQIRELFNRSSP